MRRLTENRVVPRARPENRGEETRGFPAGLLAASTMSSYPGKRAGGVGLEMVGGKVGPGYVVGSHPWAKEGGARVEVLAVTLAATSTRTSPGVSTVGAFFTGAALML